MQYAFNDFAIRQVAQLLGQSSDEAVFANRSLNYRNVFDPTVNNNGFTGQDLLLAPDSFTERS